MSLSIAGVAFGLATDVIGIEFEVVELYGFTRLVSIDDLPPFATIFTNFLVIIFAAMLWRKQNWPWLLLGAAVVFSVNAATATRPIGLIAGNLAELVFVLAWLLTLRRFPRGD